MMMSFARLALIEAIPIAEASSILNEGILLVAAGLESSFGFTKPLTSRVNKNPTSASIAAMVITCFERIVFSIIK